MATFCTISTQSHLFKSFALADSLATYGWELKILLVDELNDDHTSIEPHNVELVSLFDMKSPRTEQALAKYKNDKLRWSLKPIFLLFLLEKYEKVIYLDNDIYFFKDCKFLDEALERNNILLTPHFYPASPLENQTWLEANLRIGLYNAGFIGVNRKAQKALLWWSDCCLYEMKKSYWRGLFDDQKYLDLLPILFDGVRIIKDRGCNFAGWNDQIALLENEIVFIHFNQFTMSKFKINTSLYYDYFSLYIFALKKYKPSFELKEKQFDKFKIQNTLYYIKWNLDRLIN